MKIKKQLPMKIAEEMSKCLNVLIRPEFRPRIPWNSSSSPTPLLFLCLLHVIFYSMIPKLVASMWFRA